ncbi:hypothetical protein LCGC14_0338560 [marine sediment metagenome]|uniref:Uncharacterized protein n=1 Tax=marine sediment metagenome TaxID=412755 RepID=A0A0F9TXG7_9ZZZZ
MGNEVIVQLEECEYSGWRIRLIFPLKNMHGKPSSADLDYWEDSEEMSESGAVHVARVVADLFVNAKAQYRVPKHEITEL